MNVDDLPPDYDISKVLIPEAVTVFESVTRRPPLPHRLYHYTSADGLLGIMRTETLWATCARYMNDASEVTYGQQIVCESVEAAAKAETGIAREWLDRFVGVIPRVHDAHETYIASFCETPDMLSQWRDIRRRQRLLFGISRAKTRRAGRRQFIQSRIRSRCPRKGGVEHYWSASRGVQVGCRSQ